MGKISLPQGRGNLAHNIRSYGEGKMPSNIDVSKMQENVTIHHETLHAAYHRLFDEPVEEYNNKQKRADRKIKDYYQHVKNSKNGEKLFYEDVLQWGKKEDFEQHPELREIVKECLIEYMEGSVEKGIPSFAERNPGLELIGAYIHMDEVSPHMHFDYIPVATGYKTGMQKRNSLDRTMKALLKQRTGHEYSPRASEVDAKGKCIDNATKQWKEMERAVFRKICISRGLLVDEEIKTPERDSISVLEYKREMRKKEVAALETKADELKGEILTVEQIYEIDVHKPILGQKVKISYLELMSLKKTAEHIDAVEADAKRTSEEAHKLVEQANERADEGIKAANDRADIAIGEANKRADDAIAEAQDQANKIVEKEKRKAKKKMDEAEEIKAEAEEIISRRDSIIKEAMDKAKAIIQEAIENVPAKTKEAFTNLKNKIKELTKTKADLESEIDEKTGLGDRILREKKMEARAITDAAEATKKSIINNANCEAEEIREKAHDDAGKIMDEAIKKAGAEGVMEEISRRLGIVSMKEVADAKRKVIEAYKKYQEYDTDGSIAKAIDNNDMATIEKRYRDSYSYRADRTLERREPWHDAIFEVDMHMEEYLKLKAEPHSIDEIMEDIQAVMAYQNRGRRR